jgi:DNA-binding transcriptional ArsR family regulator
MRNKILAYLRRRPRSGATVSALVQAVGSTSQNIRQHLAGLRDEGLVVPDWQDRRTRVWRIAG